MNPSDADALADFEPVRLFAQLGNSPDDFVTENDWQVTGCGAAFDLVQLGVTNAAGGDLDEHLAVIGSRSCEVSQGERPGMVYQAARLLEHHRSHCTFELGFDCSCGSSFRS